MKADKETSLLLGLVQNDRKAIEAIYKDNYKMVQAMVIKNNGTSDDARDLFQEAMIVLYEKACSEEGQLSCQIRTFIYSVCRRLWLKRLRDDNPLLIAGDSDHEIVDASADLAEHERRDLEYRMVETAMNNMGEPCKSLLEAFYIEKKSMQEIAERFGYTNSDNAKTQKYKCLMKLKKLFFNHNKRENL